LKAKQRGQTTAKQGATALCHTGKATRRMGRAQLAAVLVTHTMAMMQAVGKQRQGVMGVGMCLNRECR